MVCYKKNVFGLFRPKQHSDNTSQGWSARRLGYLSEELFGYASARFAYERGEAKQRWNSFLSTNIAGYMKRSTAWLKTNQVPRLFSKDTEPHVRSEFLK